MVAFPLLVADDEPVGATGGIGARPWLVMLVVLVVLAAAAVAASAWLRANRVPIGNLTALARELTRHSRLGTA